MNDPREINACTHLFCIGKNFERPGDLTAHIATEGTRNLIRKWTDGICETGSMKRVLIYLLGAAIVAAAVFLGLLFRPDIAAQIFFGAAPAPVEMNLRPTHDVPAADEKSAAIVTAANVFLESLDADQRQAATYRFTDNAQRSNWSNFPEGMVPRGGVKLGALSASQREKSRQAPRGTSE